MKLESEQVIIEAPLSFSGSAKRLLRINDSPVYKAAAYIILIPVAWTFIVCWYIVFGIFLVPYRLIRRSQRKQKQEALRHREMLEHKVY